MKKQEQINSILNLMKSLDISIDDLISEDLLDIDPAKKTQEELNYSLIQASMLGSIDEVKRLIKVGANINCQDSRNDTVLMLAIRHDRIETVKVLLDAGADANAVNHDGYTALISASTSGKIEIVKILLEFGADANYKDEHGLTALRGASYWGHDEVIKLLEDHINKTK